jgi:peptidase M10/serralysin-like protein
MQEMQAVATFPNFIRALRNEYSNEYWRFFHNTVDGEAAVVTYNFMTAPQGENVNGDPSNGFVRYSASEVAAAERALREFSKVAGIKFVRGSSQSEELMMGQFDIQGAGGYASYPITDVWDGSHYGTQQLYIDASYSMEQNQYGYLALLHEIGHALGLKHPHDGGVKLRQSEDHWTHTVMSYNNAATGDFKLGVLDIIALQSIYGPPKTRVGTNTYKFGESKVIWDGGGTDTISAAHLKQKVYVDLDGGTWNYIGSKASSITASKQIWIGHFTEIEKFSSGSGSDTVYGNGLSNTLSGGKGNDMLSGRTGNDSIAGNQGDDTIHGNGGIDGLSGSVGNDTLIGGAQADRLYGGSGKDIFLFKSLGELGTLNSHDRVYDLGWADVLDFRSCDANTNVFGRQKLKFVGNFAENLMDQAIGTAYFNTTSDKLFIETTGDKVADYCLTVKGVSLMKLDDFLV